MLAHACFCTVQEVLGQLDALLAGDCAGSASSSCGGDGGAEEPELDEETLALAQRARRLVAAKVQTASIRLEGRRRASFFRGGQRADRALLGMPRMHTCLGF